MNQKRILWAIGSVLLISVGSVGGYYLFFYEEEKNEEIDGKPKIIEISIGADYLIRNLTIQIAFPDGYWNNTDKIYSSIYLLDAKYFFSENGSIDHIMTRQEGMTKITQKLIDREQIPESLLIGIMYTEYERNQYTMNNVSNFHRFFTEKLIPEIEERFRVGKSAQDRVLFGYSGSAHFSTYSLLYDEYVGIETFNKIISISGFYTDTTTTFQLEDQIYTELGNEIFQNKSFYIAIGENDGNMELADAHEVFIDKFMSRGYTNLNFNYTLYEGKGHYNIPEIAYEAAMIWMFAEDG